MSLFRAFRSRRVVVSTALLVVGLLAGPLTVHPAGATFSTCTTDPKVFLSNGVHLDITPQISDSSSDVQMITYTLHGPVGTSVTNLVYTGNDFTGKESFVYLADQVGNSYLSDTLVSTLTTPGVSVTVPVYIHDVYEHLKTSASTSGTSGLDILSQLSY